MSKPLQTQYFQLQIIRLSQGLKVSQDSVGYLINSCMMDISEKVKNVENEKFYYMLLFMDVMVFLQGKVNLVYISEDDDDYEDSYFQDSDIEEYEDMGLEKINLWKGEFFEQYKDWLYELSEDPMVILQYLQDKMVNYGWSMNDSVFMDEYNLVKKQRFYLMNLFEVGEYQKFLWELEDLRYKYFSKVDIFILFQFVNVNSLMLFFKSMWLLHTHYLNGNYQIVQEDVPFDETIKDNQLSKKTTMVLNDVIEVDSIDGQQNKYDMCSFMQSFVINKIIRKHKPSVWCMELYQEGDDMNQQVPLIDFINFNYGNMSRISVNGCGISRKLGGIDKRTLGRIQTQHLKLKTYSYYDKSEGQLLEILLQLQKAQMNLGKGCIQIQAAYVIKQLEIIVAYQIKVQKLRLFNCKRGCDYNLLASLINDLKNLQIQGFNINFAELLF